MLTEHYTFAAAFFNATSMGGKKNAVLKKISGYFSAEYSRLERVERVSMWTRFDGWALKLQRPMQMLNMHLMLGGL